MAELPHHEPPALVSGVRMNIQTRYNPPPVPTRKYDWEAFVPETLDLCCGNPACSCRKRLKIGFGATEGEAMADLLDQLEMEAQ